MTGLLKAAILRNAEDLASLEPEWWALWQSCPAATPFQSPGWLLPWWRSFAPGELHAVTVRRDGRLVGLAPLYLENGALGRRLLPIGISITDYHDVLLAPEHVSETSAVLMRELLASREWESWDMPDLAEDAQALRLPCPSGTQARLERTETCPWLALPARVEELRAALPPRKRRALAMNRNRAKRRGPVIFHSLATMSADALFGEIIRLHHLRWQQRGEAGVLNDAQVQAFHRRAVPRLAAAGLVRLYSLRIGGTIAAAYYGLAHNGRAYGYLTGFDPTFAYESPGTLIVAHAMEEAICEGVREFHFLRGEETYKYGWGAVDRWNSRLILRRRQTDAAA
jgi:CelD/BcsL family acetyltransferase involved in cellulose biosynthesis